MAGVFDLELTEEGGRSEELSDDEYFETDESSGRQQVSTQHFKYCPVSEFRSKLRVQATLGTSTLLFNDDYDKSYQCGVNDKAYCVKGITY